MEEGGVVGQCGERSGFRGDLVGVLATTESRRYSGGGGGPMRAWVYCDGQSGCAQQWGWGQEVGVFRGSTAGTVRRER